MSQPVLDHLLSGESRDRSKSRMGLQDPRHCNLGFLCWGCIKNKISDEYQPQVSITIQQLSATIVRECRNMSAVLIQNAFDMVN